MKLPGLTIVPTRAMVKQLTRIADTLDRILLEAYGVRMQPTPKPDRDESDVLYGDEEKYAIQEARDLGEFKRPDRPIDVEEFPD